MRLAAGVAGLALLAGSPAGWQTTAAADAPSGASASASAGAKSALSPADVDRVME
jgi:hypothetical protein